MARRPCSICAADGDYERSVAGQMAQRTTIDAVPLDEALVKRWLDRLFSTSATSLTACALALRGARLFVTGQGQVRAKPIPARLLALLFATAPDATQLRVAPAAPTGKGGSAAQAVH